MVSKEVGGDVRSLAKYTASLFSSGGYDFAIVVADNTVAASIALNKYEGITSAVCHDAEEARAAKSQDVNAIIIKHSGIDEADAIVNAFTKGMGIQLKIKLPEVQMPQIKMQKEEAPAQHKQQAPGKKQIPQPQARERAYDEPAAPARPGVMGWIKDSLGIVDAPEDTAQVKRKEKKVQQ